MRNTTPNSGHQLEPGFSIIHSNHMEDLRHVAVAWIRRHPLKPLENELFIVQSNGMAQWLKLALAENDGCGISAAVDILLPARFLWNAYRAVLGAGQIPRESPYDKERLVWRLLKLLPSMVTDGWFAPLAHYLADDADMRKTLSAGIPTGRFIRSVPGLPGRLAGRLDRGGRPVAYGRGQRGGPAAGAGLAGTALAKGLRRCSRAPARFQPGRAAPPFSERSGDSDGAAGRSAAAGDCLRYQFPAQTGPGGTLCRIPAQPGTAVCSQPLPALLGGYHRRSGTAAHRACPSPGPKPSGPRS